MSIESVVVGVFVLAVSCGWTSPLLIDTADKITAETYIRALASRAEKLHSTRRSQIKTCTCSVPSCWSCDPDSVGVVEGCSLNIAECDGQQSLEANATIVRTPPGTEQDKLNSRLRESICLYRSLDSRVEDVDTSFSRNGRTYIGTTDGHFRAWAGETTKGDVQNGGKDDGSEGKSCSDFDPRWRRWFAASSTGPKDVVISVDTSAAMLHEIDGVSRWVKVSEAIGTFCGTFTRFDFFNIVGFSNLAQTAFPNLLVSGTHRNVGEDLRSRLVGFSKEGDSSPAPSLLAGLSSAFDILERSHQKGSECTKVVFLIAANIECGDRTPTDAACNAPDFNGAEKVLRYISRRQRNLARKTGQRAMIFTIGIGDDVDDSLLQQIACRNRGSYTHVPDGEDPLPALSSYYAFLSSRRLSKDPIWLTPQDGDPGEGKQDIAIVAKPFYSASKTEGENGVLLGVVAHEVPLSSVQSALDESDGVGGQVCEEVDSSACRLQALRKHTGSGEVCVLRNLPEKFSCYKFGRKWYWPVSRNTQKSWGEARIQCKGQGGELAVAESDKELGMIASVAHSVGSWVGAKKSNDAFAWEADGAGEVESDFWARSHPVRGKECARIDPTGLKHNMRADDCNKELPFICVFDSQPMFCFDSTVSVSGNRINPKCRKEQDRMQAIKPAKEIASVSSDQALCPLAEGTACPRGTSVQTKGEYVEPTKGEPNQRIKKAPSKETKGEPDEQSENLIQRGENAESNKTSEAKVLGMDKLLFGCIVGAGGVLFLGVALISFQWIKRWRRAPTRPQW